MLQISLHLMALNYRTSAVAFQELSGQAVELDIKLLDKKVDQMMPELGFSSDDNDRLVASYRHVPA